MSVYVTSWVWRHSAATGSSRLVLLAIADIADDEGFAFPGINHLAGKSKLSPKTTRRQIVELEKLGELTVERRAGHGNRYVVTMLNRGQNDRGQIDPGDTSGHDRGQEGNLLLIPTHQEPSVSKEVQLDVPVSNSFDEFWKVYPRREKKIDAEESYRKALERADADTILAGCIAYAKAVAGEDKKFIALPPSWLNKSRWTDEYDEPQPETTEPDPWANKRRFGGRNG